MNDKKAMQFILDGTNFCVVTFCSALWDITPKFKCTIPQCYRDFFVLANFLYQCEATQKDMNKVAEVYPEWKPLAEHGREIQWLFKHNKMARINDILEHITFGDDKPIPEELWKIE